MGRLHYDFETKKTIKTDEEDWYIYEHKVPETVSEELWQKANDNIKKRRRDKKTRDQGNIIGKNTGRYHLSGEKYIAEYVAVHITDEPGDGIRRVKIIL